ncbi:MAG TPA: hypothetical protein VJ461_04740 [Candidatus Nanoarchaeia archaeon]|nr:hypothetical protein [Candidatus Nanoarchaeia archaeon]
MKNATIALIATVILSILLIGCTPTSPAAENIITSDNPQEAIEDYAALEGELLQETGETHSCFGFGDVETFIDGDNILIQGSVLDEVTSGALYCNANEATPVAEFDIADGKFSIETTYNKCGPGTATLKYECSGETKTTSENIPSQFVVIRGGGSPTQHAAGMPEFSVVTLGLAVIGAGLALAFLRKK